VWLRIETSQQWASLNTVANAAVEILTVCLLYAGFSLGLSFGPEDGSTVFLQNSKMLTFGGLGSIM
jgi:hypothetical protein